MLLSDLQVHESYKSEIADIDTELNAAMRVLLVKEKPSYVSM